MKKVKKIMAIVLTGVLGATLLVGCGDKKDAGLTPQESIKALIEVNIFGKKDNISKIGVSDAQFTTLQKTKDEAFKKAFMASAGLGNGTIKEEQTNSFIKTVFESIAKADIQTSNEKVDGKNATVDITVKGLDMNKVIEATTGEITKVMMANPTLPEDQVMVKFMEAYEKAIKDAPLVAEGQTITVKMVQKEGYWDVADSTEIDKIMKTLIPMK